MNRHTLATNNIMAGIFKGVNKNDFLVRATDPIKPSASERSTPPIERKEMQVVERNDLEEKVTLILANVNKDIMKRVLSLGELSLPQPQFRAFRKEVFDLFGTRELRRVARKIILECLGPNSDGFGQGRRL